MARDDTTLVPSCRPGAGRVGSFLATAMRLSTGLCGWLLARSTVKTLSALDDRALKDIGVSRREIWEAIHQSTTTAPALAAPLISDAFQAEAMHMAAPIRISTASCPRKVPSHGNGGVTRPQDRSTEQPLGHDAAHPRVGASMSAVPGSGHRLSALTINLQYKQMIGLEDCCGAEINLTSGQLWITQAGDYRDVILQFGESFRLDRNGLALVTATQPSILCIASPDANLLNRLRLE